MEFLVTLAPMIIALGALAVSVIGLMFTARTYGVTHRPYVGIIDTPFQLIESPPRAITWKLVLKMSDHSLDLSELMKIRRNSLPQPELHNSVL